MKADTEEIAEKKFWSKVQKTNTCWRWTGMLDRKGYGQNAPRHFYRKFGTHRTHVVSFLLAGKPRPAGTVLDHTCRKPNCVNPNHLRAVTPKENILCGVGLAAENARKTRCKRGHPLSADNVTIHTLRTGTKARRCRKCMALLSKKYRSVAWQSQKM